MNNTNARARIINEIFHAPEEPCYNDFSCYFLGSQNYAEPKYSVTSQRVSFETKPDEPPSFHIDSKPHILFSENVQTNLHEAKHYNCKCENCRRDKCPSKSARLQKKDNIMQFSDKSTMTSVVKDADCCCNFGKMCNRPDVTNPTSNTGSKIDNLKCLERRCPRTILKNDMSYKCAGRICRTFIDDQIAERDTIDDKEHKIDSQQDLQEKFPSEEVLDQRRTLYNEGISDQIANQFPIAPQRLPSPICVNPEQNRMPVKKYNPKCSIVSKGIPFSHKFQSKYHETCKNTSKSRINTDFDSEDIKCLVASPDIVKNGMLKSARPLRLPSIKLPRRVLTSERDIELYIDSFHPKSRKRK
ncbi:uncharacterized protein LOC114251754 [Bombyx mandarina]|uniref:Uncharacterized protein LOC114251754 n=1 Tax=Bombyx mandarina TaxID=7092 RepID=A0A6J2KLV2_BOMMA|nr:uncharacterized protein LOC114251754 [Bombyx mandarina]